MIRTHGKATLSSAWYACISVSSTTNKDPESALFRKSLAPMKVIDVRSSHARVGSYRRDRTGRPGLEHLKLKHLHSSSYGLLNLQRGSREETENRGGIRFRVAVNGTMWPASRLHWVLPRRSGHLDGAIIAERGHGSRIHGLEAYDTSTVT